MALHKSILEAEAKSAKILLNILLFIVKHYPSKIENSNNNTKQGKIRVNFLFTGYSYNTHYIYFHQLKCAIKFPIRIIITNLINL